MKLNTGMLHLRDHHRCQFFYIGDAFGPEAAEAYMREQMWDHNSMTQFELQAAGADPVLDNHPHYAECQRSVERFVTNNDSSGSPMRG